MATEECNRYFPLGCAKLETTEKETIISNLTDSGIDGIGIDTGKITEWELQFKPFEIGSKNSLNITNFGKDKYNRLKVLSQQSIFYNHNTNEVAFAFNSKLLSDKVVFIAHNKGKEVYRAEYITPRDNPCVNWWQIAVAAAIFILDHIDYEYEKEVLANGDVITREKRSWGSSESTKINTKDGIEIIADRMYLESYTIYPKGSEDSINTIKEVQITATNYNEIIITDEKTCC